MPLDRGYLLCASPRSGSTMLCDLLAQAGAGAPESYFRSLSITDMAHEWGVELDADGWGGAYVAAVRERGAAGTGCFGMRIMGGDLVGFLDRLRFVHPDASSDVERLRAVFGIRSYVHLSRDDRVAEAVSLVLARQTGLWHRHADGTERERTAPPTRPRYDHDQIAAELQLLEAEAARWSAWFEGAGIDPLRITYEALSKDPQATLSSVAEHIGIVPLHSAAVRTAKLATGMNAEWAARFRSERIPSS